MRQDAGPPAEIPGFGSCLLWLIATRGTAVIDALYRDGPPNPTKKVLMEDGHHLPTVAAVAWLLAAVELGRPVTSLYRGDPELARAQKLLAENVTRYLNETPYLFKEEWLDGLAAICGFSRADQLMLHDLRLEPGVEVKFDNLRRAVGKTRASMPAAETSPGPDSAAVSPPPAAPPPPRPRGLPRDIASFAGRAGELRQLTRAARRAGGSAGATRIFAIEGMGGVGKTALAIRAAYLVAGHFPDGQLFLNLHGYTKDVSPVGTAEALRALLDQLGMTGSLPDAEDKLRRAYCDRLAGTRTLIVLDNAADLGRAEALLPGETGCLVLVTSRRPLGISGAQVISLAVPSPADAAAIFASAASPVHVPPGDPDVAEALRLCGYLPLAVAILGARLARGRALSTAHMLAELSHERRRLAELSDGERNVAAVLELSYGNLPEPARGLFHRLGVVPGPDFDLPAVMSLPEDGDVAGAPAALDTLLDHNLLIRDIPGRYRFHDLVRVFAKLKAEPLGPAGQAARTRLLDYYLATAQAADSLLDRRIPRLLPYRDPQPPREAPDLATTADGHAWLERELPNLEAAIREAAGGQHPQYAADLAAAAADHLRAVGPWATAANLHRIARQAAARLGDPVREVAAQIHLGVIERQRGDLTAAVDTLTRAQAAAQAAGHGLAIGGALLELGVALRISAQPALAVDALEDALKAYQDEQSDLGAATALRELGSVQRQLSEFARARSSLEDALALYQELGSRSGEAATLAYLASLGVAASAPYAQTRDLATRALRMYEELGDRVNQANCLLTRGSAHLRAGQVEPAFTDLGRAREIFHGLGDQRSEAGCLAFLGNAQRLSGELEQARHSLLAAIMIFQEVPDTGGEAESLNLYGELALSLGEPWKARPRFSEALRIAGEIGSTEDARVARDGLARCDEAERAAPRRARLRAVPQGSRQA